MNAALPINPTIIRIMRVLRIARGTAVFLASYVFPPQTIQNVFVWSITNGCVLVMGFSVLLPNSTEAFEDGYRHESPAGHSNASFTTGT